MNPIGAVFVAVIRGFMLLLFLIPLIVRYPMAALAVFVVAVIAVLFGG